MGQQTIFGRIAQLTKANINALLDAAEDPEKMLDQMIRDYKNNIAEAEEAVAQTIGNLRLMEAGREGSVRSGRGVGLEGAGRRQQGEGARRSRQRAPRRARSRTSHASRSRSRSPSRTT